MVNKRFTAILPESYYEAIEKLIEKKWILNKSEFVRTAVYNELKMWFKAIDLEI